MVAHDVQPIWTGGDGRQRTTEAICKCIVARGVAAGGGLTYTSYIPAKRLQTGPDQVQHRAGRAASGVAGGGVTFEMTLSQLCFLGICFQVPVIDDQQQRLCGRVHGPGLRFKNLHFEMDIDRSTAGAALQCLHRAALRNTTLPGQSRCSGTLNALHSLHEDVEQTDQWGRNTSAVTTAAASDFDSGATSAARNQVGASSRRKRTDTDALCSRLQIGAGTGFQVPKLMDLLISHDTLVDYDCLAGWLLRLKTHRGTVLPGSPSPSREEGGVEKIAYLRVRIQSGGGSINLERAYAPRPNGPLGRRFVKSNYAATAEMAPASRKPTAATSPCLHALLRLLAAYDKERLVAVYSTIVMVQNPGCEQQHCAQTRASRAAE
ncbi:hypothetical protein CMUS01_08656 [Colletotrichum musicola]|uniref:Uncharacterized protein n=1 Tax=Colletotrichum musicola TaxID=2175873 RepID=A0A8H6NC91_9PEZI|nr:hypothetical protein CMUS01_08656 [Colletotrichum musicola]